MERFSITDVADFIEIDKLKRINGTENADIIKTKAKREIIYNVLDSPNSSKYAFLYSIFILSVILLSVVIFILESLPQYWSNMPLGLFGLETFCVSIFTLDYVGKLFTVKKWYLWIIRPMTIVDLLSILPFYIELLVESETTSLATLRILRLLRIFRTFKVEKYSRSLRIITRTAAGIREHMLLMVFSTLLGIIVLSSLVFFAEQTGSKYDASKDEWIRDLDDSTSPFESIVATMWYTMVTLTTVGYGDMYPVSNVGKLVGALVVISSILVLGFPISIVGDRFLKEWEHSKKKQIKQNLIEEWRAAGMLEPGHSMGELVRALEGYREELKVSIECKQQKYELLLVQYAEMTEVLENLNHALKYREKKS